jgi:hypothetical protein
MCVRGNFCSQTFLSDMGDAMSVVDSKTQSEVFNSSLARHPYLK